MRAAVVLLAALLAGNVAGAEAPAAVVFTLSSMPVRTGAVQVYELDRREVLEAETRARLPGDPVRAAAVMRRRLGSEEGRRLRDELATALEGSVLAGRLGVERLPAIVFEGRYVVYGVRDVERAREMVEEWTAVRGLR